MRADQHPVDSILDAAAWPGTHATTGRVENHRRLTTIEQIRTWCREGHVTIKPVIDLDVPLTHAGYEVPDRIAEHIALRDKHCVFPWCTRAATAVRHRPRHPLAPRLHDHRQPRRPGPTAPPAEDPLHLDLHRPGPRHLPVVEPARLPVPGRRHRHTDVSRTRPPDQWLYCPAPRPVPGGDIGTSGTWSRRLDQRWSAWPGVSWALVGSGHDLGDVVPQGPPAA